MSGDTVRTTLVDGEAWLNIGDLIEHLKVSQESVTAWCGDASPTGTAMVVETIQVTVDFLHVLVGEAFK